MATRVTLGDVARACGVSKATASQGLRGDRRIAEKTRLRLRQVATELGYQPDPIISDFATRRFHHNDRLAEVTILHVSSRALSGQPMRFVPELRREVGRRGYRFEHVNIAPEADLAVLQQEWHDAGVRGLILGNMIAAPWLGDRDWGPFSVVGVGGSVGDRRHHIIKCDVADSTHEVWERVHADGWKRIGFAICEHAIPIMDDFLRIGVARQIAARERLPVPVYVGPLLEPAGLREWVRRWNPDAIIAFPSGMRDWGEVRDEPKILPVIYPLTLSRTEASWNENDAEVVARAVDLIDAMIRRSETGFPSSRATTLIKGFWQERPAAAATTAIPAAAAGI